MKNHLKITFIITLAAFPFLFGACNEPETRVKYLVRDNSLNGYFTMDKNSVTMYASPEDKAAGRAECVLYQDEYTLYSRLFRDMNLTEMREIYLSKGTGRFPDSIRNSVLPATVPERKPGSLPLAGLVVALDPGHMARTFKEGMKEGKYLLLQDGKHTIRFYEAELNLRTSILLGSMLEADGARVIYTRNGGLSPNGYTFPPLAARNLGWITDRMASRITRGKATVNELFHYYSRVSDLARRAEIINGAAPHLTISIHYNMAMSRADSASRINEIKKIMEDFEANNVEKLSAIDDVIRRNGESDVNYSVVFIPGAFMAGELEGVEARMNFLRLLVTDDLKNSIRLGALVAQEFRKKLDIPHPGLDFSCRNNRYTGEEGVFARNFRMTRLVAGPVCLGEPLIQNYPEEARNLSTVSAGEIPERITQVASAYHRAILRYAREMD